MKHQNKLLIKILTFMALSSAFLMAGFELIKQFLHSDITIWESHFATIGFTSLVSVLLTYLALQKHQSLLKILSGFIPICAWCKKIRDEDGKWVSFDVYLGRHSDAEITHGICPECEKLVFKKKIT